MADQITVKPAKRGKDKKPRAMDPKSLANLKPATPGDANRNPTGKNGREKRMYTDSYVLTGESVVPEALRLLMNAKIRLQLKALLRVESDDKFRKYIKEIAQVDLIEPGVSWAQANAIRMHVNVLLEGDVSAAVEVREAVEGRVEQRIVITERNDRLKQLLNAFSVARADAQEAKEKKSENG